MAIRALFGPSIDGRVEAQQTGALSKAEQCHNRPGEGYRSQMPHPTAFLEQVRSALEVAHPQRIRALRSGTGPHSFAEVCGEIPNPSMVGCQWSDDQFVLVLRQLQFWSHAEGAKTLLGLPE